MPLGRSVEVTTSIAAILLIAGSGALAQVDATEPRLELVLRDAKEVYTALDEPTFDVLLYAEPLYLREIGFYLAVAPGIVIADFEVSPEFPWHTQLCVWEAVSDGELVVTVAPASLGCELPVELTEGRLVLGSARL